jgi:hypothetical protein
MKRSAKEAEGETEESSVYMRNPYAAPVEPMCEPE